MCPNLNGSPYFLFLSRLHEKKGVDLLLKAFSIQLKKVQKAPRRFPKLVLAGPGIDSSYGLKLRQAVQEDSALYDNVIFTGLLLGDSKWGAYYGCEAFILPSHQENFGIVVVEALACAKPVLISDKINIWQEIEKAGAGIARKNSCEGVLELFETWETLTEEEKKLMQSNSQFVFEKNYASTSAASRLLSCISK